MFCALAMLHLNLTHEQAAALLIPYVGGHYSAPHIWKKFIQPALKLSDEAGNLADTERRFSIREKAFCMVLSILDGVPMYSRGPSELYNAKKAAKYWTFQVLLMMDGCPLAWSGPFEGRIHDSECLAQSDIPSFMHRRDEMIIADKAYIDNRHCFCQEVGPAIDETFDMEFRRIRNRVERFFAHMDQHKLLHYNQHRKDFARSAFGLLWNAECTHWKVHQVTLYDDSVESLDSTHSVVREWASRDFCSCHFQKGDKKDKDDIREYREEVNKIYSALVSQKLEKALLMDAKEVRRTES